MSPILTIRTSPLAVVSFSPFLHEEWRILALATGAPSRQSEQRHQSADSWERPTAAATSRNSIMSASNSDGIKA